MSLFASLTSGSAYMDIVDRMLADQVAAYLPWQTPNTTDMFPVPLYLYT